MTVRTVEACLNAAADRLAAAGIQGARMEARLLLAHCLGETAERLIVEMRDRLQRLETPWSVEPKRNVDQGQPPSTPVADAVGALMADCCCLFGQKLRNLQQIHSFRQGSH